jgi:hypothetical protein
MYDLHAPAGTTRPRNIVVFSGGSAANSLVDLFVKITENKKCQLSYIIPISDNGGSSSELIRVFGGPGNNCPLSINDSVAKTVQVSEIFEVCY